MCIDIQAWFSCVSFLQGLILMFFAWGHSMPKETSISLASSRTVLRPF